MSLTKILKTLILAQMTTTILIRLRQWVTTNKFQKENIDNSESYFITTGVTVTNADTNEVIIDLFVKFQISFRHIWA